MSHLKVNTGMTKEERDQIESELQRVEERLKNAEDRTLAKRNEI